MKKQFFVILAGLMLLLGFTNVSAQVAPDNKVIEREIGDSTSIYFYPKLFNRYLKCDTTLTVEDYRHLYYGYMFQPEYSPFETMPEADSVLAVFNRKEVPELTDFRIVINNINRLMIREPFNPRHLNMLVYAYGQIGDSENEIKNYDRFSKLMETIMSSGTGLKENSPWHIISFSHTEDVMGYLDLRYVKRVVISRTCEYVPLLVKKDGVKGYFFDFSRIYTRKPEKSEQKAGFMINNLKVK